MLTITIPAKEGWDENTQEFVHVKEQTLCLEHSLVSLSKWEAKYHKPFIGTEKKTAEELLYYVQCMTITQNVDPKTYSLLSQEELEAINNYIQDSRTATWFNDRKTKTGATAGRSKNETVTSELIYYWMVSFQIPFECQRWHLNRLLTLIRICKIKEQQDGKSGRMSKRDILSQNAALNAARRSRMHTKG